MQVMSTLTGCIQKQKYGKECQFNTKWHRYLKEVISCSGSSEEGMAASRWYLLSPVSRLVNNTETEKKDETDRISFNPSPQKPLCFLKKFNPLTVPEVAD